MKLSQWIVPALWLTSSCSDPVGNASSSPPVSSGGATSMAGAAPAMGGTGTASPDTASNAGTAPAIGSGPLNAAAGGGPGGNASVPSAGAAGSSTVPSSAGATATSQGGTAGSPVLGVDAGAGAGGGGGAALGGNSGGLAALGGASAGETASAGSAGETGAAGAGGDLLSLAAGFHELFLHDACTGVEPSQPDTCLHEQLIEESFTFGGEAPGSYAVTLRVRGLFEPTTISGGEAPLPEHPYFRVGGSVSAVDWSQWQIEISDPPETYWLNHYPSTSHTIYQEDFEATLDVAAGASVTVRVVDGNNRQMDNAEEGLEDRRQLIEGVTDEVLDGQMLRLDVVDVVAQ